MKATRPVPEDLDRKWVSHVAGEPIAVTIRSIPARQGTRVELELMSKGHERAVLDATTPEAAMALLSTALTSFVASLKHRRKAARRHGREAPG